MSDSFGKIGFLKILGNQRSNSNTYSRLVQALSSSLNINLRTGNLDAATISLSESFRTDKTIATRARNNVNDANNMVTKASDAVDALDNILAQMASLSGQAESSGISSDTRTAIGEEFEALRQQYNSIVSNTYHNDKNLLAGQAQEVRVQAGAGTENTIQFSVGAELSGTVGGGGGGGGATGDGTFGSGTTAYNTPSGTISTLTTGDFDNDGYEDVATTNGTNVQFLYGNGDGTFDTTHGLVTALSTFDIHTANTNGDAYDDLVIIASNGTILSYTSNGNRTFTLSDTEVGVSPAGGAVDDFDNDGDIDVVSSLNGGANLRFNAGDGSGGFGMSAAAGNLSSASVSTPNKVVSGNLTADANKDIVVAKGSGIQVMTGNGNGTFTSGTTYSAGVSFSSITMGDIDGDGNKDIVAASSTTLYAYLGNGDGTFDAPTTVSTSGYKDVQLADLNGDGDLDVIGHQGGTIVTHLGDGAGNFAAETVYGSGTTNGFGTAVADFNEDGVTDVVYSDDSDDIIYRQGGTTGGGGGGGGTSYDRQIGSLSLSSTANAATASDTIAIYQDFVTREKGNLSAQSTRLGSAYQILDRQATNNETAMDQVLTIDTATILADTIAASIRSETGDKALQYHSISVQQAARIYSLISSGAQQA